MIYVKKENVKEEHFLELLNKARKSLLVAVTKEKSLSATLFESLVYKNMRTAALKTEFEGTIVQTGVFAFPDIVAKGYFGVEVKMTTKDQWTSTGNSILESSREKDVEKIYIMFGKLGGKTDIRYRLYQECLPEISVTHSPRYKINMDLPKGETIFDKMGIDYNVLRKKQNPIDNVKNYYRSQLKEGEELWWIDPGREDRMTSLIIKSFRSLSEKEKDNFIVESMILFPEIFGNSTTKYSRASAYLVTEYNTVSANLRDFFSSGGRETIEVKGLKINIPKIYFKMYTRSMAIRSELKELDGEILSHYWRVEVINRDRLTQWKRLLNKNAITDLPLDASEIFDAGT